MNTDQLIELISDAQSGEYVDWRPVVSQLDSSGFQIDTPSETGGWTLLQWALEHGNNQAASFAISRGASINAQGTGEFACTPLDIAVRTGNDTYVDMFLRHGGTGALPATSKRMDLIAKGKDAIRELIAGLDTDSFVEAIKRSEELFGVTAKREMETGVVRFRKVSLATALSLAGKKKEQLAQTISSFAELSTATREHNATIYAETWLGTSLKKADVILAPTGSDIVLLTALAAVAGSPLCGNHQLFSSLMELYEHQEFRVLSVDRDAIVLRFVENVENPEELAEQVIHLFPFVRDYHTAGAGQPDEIDVSRIVAEDIRDESAVHIIYHAF